MSANFVDGSNLNNIFRTLYAIIPRKTSPRNLRRCLKFIVALEQAAEILRPEISVRAAFSVVIIIKSDAKIFVLVG